MSHLCVIILYILMYKVLSEETTTPKPSENILGERNSELIYEETTPRSLGDSVDERDSQIIYVKTTSKPAEDLDERDCELVYEEISPKLSGDVGLRSLYILPRTSWDLPRSSRLTRLSGMMSANRPSTYTKLTKFAAADDKRVVMKNLAGLRNIGLHRQSSTENRLKAREEPATSGQIPEASAAAKPLDMAEVRVTSSNSTTADSTATSTTTSKTTAEDYQSSGVRSSVGEEAVEEGHFPWQVALHIGNSLRTWACGGSLISREWLITAAHCLLQVERIKAIIGTTSMLKPSNGSATVDCWEYATHPNYSGGSNYDIGAVKLPQPVEFTDKIKPVFLPKYSQENETFSGKTATLSGWGKTTLRGKLLEYVTLKVITNEECAVTSPEILCTQGVMHRGICAGDSGSSLVVKDGGRPVLIGIVSWGRHCGRGLPDGYTRVTSFLHWIRNTTGVVPDP